MNQNEKSTVTSISLAKIDSFEGHPFKVKDDEDMALLVQSIRENGVITPVTLRVKEDGRYELVSGHRRVRACEILGYDSVPAEIKAISRDEAILQMVDANLQRSSILPSEKAFAYKMKLEAMKRQAQRSDQTFGPVGQKQEPVNSREELAQIEGESSRQIQRYIRLTNLIPEILEMVDEKKIAMRPAVEISYLTETEQKNLYDTIVYLDAMPSHAQAIRLRKFSQDHKLSKDVIESIMYEEKPNQREKFSMPASIVHKYIPPEVPQKQAEEYIEKALNYYRRYRERQEYDR